MGFCSHIFIARVSSIASLSSLPIWVTMNSKLFEAETISTHSVQLQITVLTLLLIYTEDFSFQRYTGGHSTPYFQKRNMLHINILVNHVQLILTAKQTTAKDVDPKNPDNI